MGLHKDGWGMSLQMFWQEKKCPLHFLSKVVPINFEVMLDYSDMSSVYYIFIILYTNTIKRFLLLHI